MNDPEFDPDLREAFQRWKTQEGESAPAFRPVRSARPRSVVWMRLAFAAFVAVLAGVALFRFSQPHRESQPVRERTLALALPEPLLRPASPGGFDLQPLPSGLPGWGALPSDFLLPQSSNIP